MDGRSHMVVVLEPAAVDPAISALVERLRDRGWTLAVARPVDLPANAEGVLVPTSVLESVSKNLEGATQSDRRRRVLALRNSDMTSGRALALGAHVVVSPSEPDEVERLLLAPGHYFYGPVSKVGAKLAFAASGVATAFGVYQQVRESLDPRIYAIGAGLVVAATWMSPRKSRWQKKRSALAPAFLLLVMLLDWATRSGGR